MLVLEILVKDNVVIVLLHMLGQSEVLGKEAHKFVRWTVIRELVWLHALVLQHYVEELTSVPTPLYTAVNIEVEN